MLKSFCHPHSLHIQRTEGMAKWTRHLPPVFEIRLARCLIPGLVEPKSYKVDVKLQTRIGACHYWDRARIGWLAGYQNNLTEWDIMVMVLVAVATLGNAKYIGKHYVYSSTIYKESSLYIYIYSLYMVYV